MQNNMRNVKRTIEMGIQNEKLRWTLGVLIDSHNIKTIWAEKDGRIVADGQEYSDIRTFLKGLLPNYAYGILSTDIKDLEKLLILEETNH